MNVVIAGDFLRPSLDGSFNQAANVKWLAQILKPSLEEKGIAVYSTENDFLGLSYLDIFSASYEQALGIELLNRWAQCYEVIPNAPIFEELCHLLVDSIVVIFEPSRSICTLFEAHQIRYVAVSIHPLRFADDLLLTFNCNDQAIRERLAPYAKTRAWQMAQWEQFSRSSVTLSPLPEPGNSLVFLAQIAYDASLILNGQYFSISDAQDLIQQLAAGKNLYLKPHPYHAESSLALQWLELFPQTQILQNNWYEFLASNKDIRYISVSSGSAYEAQLAGCEATYLNPHAKSLQNPSWKSRYAIGSEIWDPNFWPYILLNEGKTPQTLEHLRPHQLRHVIKQWWSKPHEPALTQIVH